MHVCRSFLDAVLPHMTKLSSLLTGSNSSSTEGPPSSTPTSTAPSAEGAAAAKLTLLHLLARLLSLDAQRVLLHNPSRDSSEFLFSSYCGFLTARLVTLGAYCAYIHIVHQPARVGCKRMESLLIVCLCPSNASCISTFCYDLAHLGFC